MTNVVVVGAQWGDEGKGKIVDWLSERADVVVRFQGGHNAGHTLVIGGKTFKLSLLPSGVVRPDKLSVIGNGVVVDPWALVDEIGKLKKQGVAITPRQSPHRRERDADPAACTASSINFAKRRRAPKKSARRGAASVPPMKIKSAAAPSACRIWLRPQRSGRRSIASSRITTRFAVASASPRSSKDKLIAELTGIAPQVLPYMDVTWELLDAERRQGKRILFEGAQGALLDVDHGTYPLRHLVEHGGGAGGNGFGRRTARRRATCSALRRPTRPRVGAGPFPTELMDAVGEKIGERGREFGTVTGRKRRCGWFDSVLVRQVAKVSGIDGIALTKLDVLDGFDTIRICVGYKLDGEHLNRLPASASAQAKIVPVYEDFEGWSQSTQGARRWADLPAQAVKYVRRVEELIECPVTLLSTSPERDDTILMKDPFE